VQVNKFVHEKNAVSVEQALAARFKNVEDLIITTVLSSLGV